jgi:hypothetical protein
VRGGGVLAKVRAAAGGGAQAAEQAPMAYLAGSGTLLRQQGPKGPKTRPRSDSDTKSSGTCRQPSEKQAVFGLCYRSGSTRSAWVESDCGAGGVGVLLAFGLAAPPVYVYVRCAHRQAGRSKAGTNETAASGEAVQGAAACELPSPRSRFSG